MTDPRLLEVAADVADVSTPEAKATIRSLLAEIERLHATLAAVGGKVCVVMGTSGEYSDRREWVVCAYTDEALAKAHVEAAAARSREIAAQVREWWESPQDGEQPRYVSQWDWKDQAFFGEEATYWIETVEPASSHAEAWGVIEATREPTP